MTIRALPSSFLFCKSERTSTSCYYYVAWNRYQWLRDVTILWCAVNIVILFIISWNHPQDSHCTGLELRCIIDLSMKRRYLGNVCWLKQNWASQESGLKSGKGMERQSVSHPCQIIINSHLWRCQRQQYLSKLFLKNRNFFGRLYWLSRYKVFLWSRQDPKEPILPFYNHVPRSQFLICRTVGLK